MIPTSVLETYKTSSNEENISQIFSEKMSSILPLITPKNSMIEDSSILLDLNSNPQIFVQK